MHVGLFPFPGFWSLAFGIFDSTLLGMTPHPTLPGRYTSPEAKPAFVDRLFDRGARQMMAYYWETMDQCVPPETVVAAMRAGGFAAVERKSLGGMFSEYSGVKAQLREASGRPAGEDGAGVHPGSFRTRYGQSSRLPPPEPDF
jgi:hypothetical protein